MSPDAWERWGRTVAGYLLLASAVVATVTFGYAVVGDRVAAYCIPEAAP